MVGRKTSFKPAYCNEIIECLSQGHSVVGFAGSIGVGRSTVFDWLAKHPEFADAYEVAKAKAAFWWEKRHIEFCKTGVGSAGGIIFGLGNRAADDWRTVQKHEHTGRDGSPIQVNITGVDAGLL